MFSQPVMAAAEKITDLELGLDFELSKGRIRLNGYRIQFLNEQLKNIDIEQEGEYDYYTADSTEHTGFEWEAYYIFNSKVSFSANGAYMLNLFSNGNFCQIFHLHFSIFQLHITIQTISSCSLN
ncbi:hypothetical protein CM15mP37_03980 [bacterium]|nr:MAG: hypothetical protein CM15mP37_03980 [bacterium]